MLIKGKVKWAYLFEKNELSDSYMVDICNLSDEDVKELEAAGVPIKSDADKRPEDGKYVTAKSKKIKPWVKDRDKNLWNPSVGVGNGSMVIASVNAYEWTFKGKRGVSCGLNGVTVVRLVEFSGHADEDEGLLSTLIDEIDSDSIDDFKAS